jgi:hypothetical protein
MFRCRVAHISCDRISAIKRAGTNDAPWVQIESTSFMIGIGGQGGDGQLFLPNLGTNCVHPFNVSGFGAGIQVGVSRISASGPVKSLTRVEDFPGTYSSTQGEATLVAGRGTMSLKNNANNVSLDLASQTTGIALGISGQGLTIDMPEPPVNAPRVYVLEFGFNKDFVNADSRKALNELMEAWKCRYVNIEVAGILTQLERNPIILTCRSYGRRPCAITSWVGVSFPPASRLTSRGKATCRCRQLTASACVVTAWL